MDARESFLVAYREHHAGLPDRMMRRLAEQQVRIAPAEGVNTIAWLLWHMARTEDAVVNLVVGDRRQVFAEGDWGRRLRVERREVGVAMSADDARAVSSRLDLAALRDYWEAVGARTEAVVAELRPEELTYRVAAERVHQAIVEEGIIPDAKQVYDGVHGFWSGKPKTFLLQYYALGHNLLHFGEAQAIRGLIGPPRHS
jgi:hypothetical protein